MRSWTCNLCPKPSAVKNIQEPSVSPATPPACCHCLASPAHAPATPARCPGPWMSMSAATRDHGGNLARAPHGVARTYSRPATSPTGASAPASTTRVIRFAGPWAKATVQPGSGTPTAPGRPATRAVPARPPTSLRLLQGPAPPGPGGPATTDRSGIPAPGSVRSTLCWDTIVDQKRRPGGTLGEDASAQVTVEPSGCCREPAWASVTLTPRARSSATLAATSETRTAKANPPPPARRVASIAGQAGPKPARATPGRGP